MPPDNKRVAEDDPTAADNAEGKKQRSSSGGDGSTTHVSATPSPPAPPCHVNVTVDMIHTVPMSRDMMSQWLFGATDDRIFHNVARRLEFTGDGGAGGAGGGAGGGTVDDDGDDDDDDEESDDDDDEESDDDEDEESDNDDDEESDEDDDEDDDSGNNAAIVSDLSTAHNRVFLRLGKDDATISFKEMERKLNSDDKYATIATNEYTVYEVMGRKYLMTLFHYQSDFIEIILSDSPMSVVPFRLHSAGIYKDGYYSFDEIFKSFSKLFVFDNDEKSFKFNYVSVSKQFRRWVRFCNIVVNVEKIDFSPRVYPCFEVVDQALEKKCRIRKETKKRLDPKTTWYLMYGIEYLKVRVGKPAGLCDFIICIGIGSLITYKCNVKGAEAQSCLELEKVFPRISDVYEMKVETTDGVSTRKPGFVLKHVRDVLTTCFEEMLPLIEDLK